MTSRQPLARLIELLSLEQLDADPYLAGTPLGEGRLFGIGRAAGRGRG